MEIMKGCPNLFFTADQHFGHDHLIKKQIRKFATVEDMDEAIIARHNAVVRRGDLVYSLGDMFLKIEVDRAREIRRRLVGNFYFIEGNHDQVARKLAKEGAFVWFRQLESIRIGPPWLGEKQTVVLCHYAMRTWQSSHKGSWQLYGHSHNNLPEKPHLLSFDVGVDVPEWCMHPVSAEQVIQRMRRKIPAWLAYKESLKGTDRVE